MSQGLLGLSGSQEEWRPELRFARRKTTKREWNFVHNLDTIASSCISTSKISPRAECIITSPPHFCHPGSVDRKRNSDSVVTSSPMALLLPTDGTLDDDEHREEDEFDAGVDARGGGKARAQKDLTSIAADEHPAADDSDLSHKDTDVKSSVEPESAERSTRSSAMKRSRNRLVNQIENVSAIEIPENTAPQQSSTRQRLTSIGTDDSSSTNGMLNKAVSVSIMGSTPKPGKEQMSRKKMVSLSQYHISVSEQIEEEEKRKQEPNQNTQITLKQGSGNKFYRTILPQDNNLTSSKSSSKSSSGLSKQSSSKKREELHFEEVKENSKYSLRQSSLRKRLRSDMSDIEAEDSQAVLKQESQAKRSKSVCANEKKIVAIQSQRESIQKEKRHLTSEKDDVGKGDASKQSKKGIFGVQPISSSYSQNMTQSTPLSLKFSKEHECVEVKQHDERLKKKIVAMKNNDSVGACAVYMWNTGEMKRGAKDITDLDVSLDCIIKTLESERDLCQSKSQKKALSYLQTYMKREIKDMIQKHHEVRKIQSSIKKKNSQIVHLRKQLLETQKKRFKQIGDHAKGKRDNSAKNAQKISNCLALLEAFVKETPCKTIMERKNSRSLIELKMVTVGYFPSVA
ncbi:hypothetical protein CHS0354_033142 [Potamilus streckersoni]|uniref:MLF1-interacting protein n=1 Tax=Potamilus streckersoni TaxID=2493646 RepID=A0AAE0VR64_9BIVA|nr:hypothetical protein CHS0354_033142 [Potamilus streckersoni]